MKLLRRSVTGLSLAAALAVTGAGVAAAGPTQGDAGTPAPSAGGLEVKDYTVLGPVDQNTHVVARDNGQSVFYQGRSYWFFDDTMLQDPDGFLSSTSASTSDLDASDGITLRSTTVFDRTETTAPTEFVPYSDAENAFQQEHASDDCTGSTDPNCGTQFAFWPGAVVADPSHHRILVFYGKLCRGGRDSGPCASGFVGQALGSGIVSVDMRTHAITRLAVEHQDSSLTSPEGHDPTLLFSPAEAWGSGGAVVVGQELYAYGKCTSANDCAVARVRLGDVQDHDAWTYYTGDDAHGRPQWSHDPSGAVAVMKGGAAGETVQYDPTTGSYMNTFMPSPFLDKNVYYQTAPHPWGPWSTQRTLFATQSTDGVDYAAFAHPEYTTDHGLTRYYTYYASSTGQQMLVKVDFKES